MKWQSSPFTALARHVAQIDGAVALRCIGPGKAEKEVRIGDGPKGIRNAAQAAAELEARKVEVLDESSRVLSVWKPKIKPSAAVEEEEVIGPSADEADPNDDAETRRFKLVSRLLAQAYQHSTNVAFDRLLGLVDAFNKRADSNEKVIQQQSMQIAKLVSRLSRRVEGIESGAVEEENPLAPMLSAFMARTMGVKLPSNGAKAAPQSEPEADDSAEEEPGV